MRIILVLSTFFCFVNCVAAQELIPFRFVSEDESRFIRETDSLKFYSVGDDSDYTVCINEESSYYKLLNKDQKVIAEGAFIADGEKNLRDGKWIQRFASGKVKRTGYYRRDMPVGTWEDYYANGKIKTVSNYGVFDNMGEVASCLSGSYQEYYKEGGLKANGWYIARVVTQNDTVVVNDPVTGKDVNKLVPHKKLVAEKLTPWEYYSETGEPEKKDEH